MTLMRKCIINLLLLLCMIGAQAQNTATSSTVIPVSRNAAVNFAVQMYGGSDSVNYYVSESLVHASHPGSGPIIWQPSKPLKVNGSNANLSQYKVKVIADGDGAFNYAETSLTGTQSIQNVESDGQQTSVVLKEATDCDAKLQLSSVSGVVPTQEYSIGKGIQTCSIPTSGLKDGVYQVSLIENGHVIDTKKFVK